jgi:hypothetical protein
VVGGISIVARVYDDAEPLVSRRLYSCCTPLSNDLNQTDTLLFVATGSWGASAVTPSDDGSNKFIIVNPPVGNRFYRLMK